MKSSWYCYCITLFTLSGVLLACSQQSDDSFEPTPDGKSDDLYYPESTNQPNATTVGGMSLIAGVGPTNCFAYPVSDRGLITLTSCIEECIANELCDMAVMTDNTDIEYHGLVSAARVIPAPSSLPEDDRFTLIEVPKSQAWRIHNISEQLGASQYTIDGQGQVTVSETGLLQFTPENGTCSSTVHGLFNESDQLIGLSDGQSCTYHALSLWADEIALALTGVGTPLPRETFIEEETTDELEQDAWSEAEEQREANEARWASENAEAESRAPSYCVDSERYCDGDIELTCVNGVYQAFNCAQVTWVCSTDDRFGAGCVPAN